jgi:hypothetical protein
LLSFLVASSFVIRITQGMLFPFPCLFFVFIWK